MIQSSWLDWCKEFKKAPFGDTLKITLELFKQGKSIKQISKEREIKEENIQRHFIVLIVKGLVHVEDIVSEKKIGVIMKSLETKIKLSEVKEEVGESISYFEIKAVLASLGVEAEKRV